MNYFNFFFGTPRRLLFSLVAVGVILAIIFPDALGAGLSRLSYSILDAVGPLIGMILAVLIVLAGLKIIFGGKK
ncbi:hypothetical protein CVU82_02775 [Candidatus Falkowbacteria bacterium HGW-Falkowbacteria-1]|jgi:hypothetical protein|uniref:Uncharacterized protein n=1 Tax=Candidatus Falkowbacteria bacterium HGW-Falkowbacteria-1 TaxID=2013768 RepID=A0A2N2E9Y7_9BACT|nr:MAG: hypothetical protein CVU82_02775 [Candidatus Falkowbacteria bacterium HGW-Falkowbacteria-1]